MAFIPATGYIRTLKDSQYLTLHSKCSLFRSVPRVSSRTIQLYISPSTSLSICNTSSRNSPQSADGSTGRDQSSEWKKISQNPNKEQIQNVSKQSLRSDSNSSTSPTQTNLEEENTVLKYAGGGKDGGNSNDNDFNDDSGQDDSESKNTFSSIKQQQEIPSDDTRLSFVSNVGKVTGSVTTGAAKLKERLLSHLAVVVKTVPPPVLVALISLFSTMTGSRMKAKRDLRIAMEDRKAAAEKRKTEIETQLRTSYEERAAPILKSAATLADRFYILFNSDTINEADGVDKESAKFTAYLIGRYFGTVEILKQHRTMLDYGFPTADRILANILGRVQGLFAACDGVIEGMQFNEHFFNPPPGEEPLNGGLLYIPLRTQLVMGELVTRRKWRPSYKFIDANGAAMQTGSASILSFYEFSRLLDVDPSMQEWFQPLVKECETLEEMIRKLPKNKRRSNGIGARIFFLQAGMLDLVEFFDPLPYGRLIPNSRRRRIQLGPMSHHEEQRVPLSLHKLYHELADIRDHRVEDGSRNQRLRLPHGVEVYVTGSIHTDKNGVRKLSYGDCPFSHRVLIALHELGISHKIVPIPKDRKPLWFYLLQPQNVTPVIYHDGNVIDDSGEIVSYLLRSFPEAPPLASSESSRIVVGTGALTKFHYYFFDWIKGNDSAKIKFENQLRCLNGTLVKAQSMNEGKPFFGGDRFSREDTAVAPILHNVAVVGKELKNWKLPAEFTALQKYVESARMVPSFAETVGDDKAIVRGYKQTVKRRRPRHLLDDLLD